MLLLNVIQFLCYLQHPWATNGNMGDMWWGRARFYQSKTFLFLCDDVPEQQHPLKLRGNQSDNWKCEWHCQQLKNPDDSRFCVGWHVGCTAVTAGLSSFLSPALGTTDWASGPWMQHHKEVKVKQRAGVWDVNRHSVSQCLFTCVASGHQGWTVACSLVHKAPWASHEHCGTTPVSLPWRFL